MITNALTIDLEDWYQGLSSTSQQVERWPLFEDRVVASTERLLDILASAGVRATFFTLGYLAEQFPHLVRRVADAGHELALHGYHHRQVFRLTPEEFRQEIVRGRQAVEQAGGQPICGHRAPMFSINKSAQWAFQVLHELGFLYDSSVFPTRNMLYGYPDAPRSPYRPLPGTPFMEFPMSTVLVGGRKLPVSGGFYLRFLPYALFKRAIRRLNGEGLPLVFYLHPWELDPDHPRSPLSRHTLRERFTHYWGLGSVERKLRALLQEFSFDTMMTLYRKAEAGVTMPAAT